MTVPCITQGEKKAFGPYCNIILFINNSGWFSDLVKDQHCAQTCIMADKLRPDELAAFKAAFDMFDKNQDGTISTKVHNCIPNF